MKFHYWLPILSRFYLRTFYSTRFSVLLRNSSSILCTHLIWYEWISDFLSNELNKMWSKRSWPNGRNWKMNQLNALPTVKVACIHGNTRDTAETSHTFRFSQRECFFSVSIEFAQKTAFIIYFIYANAMAAQFAIHSKRDRTKIIDCFCLQVAWASFYLDKSMN